MKYEEIKELLKFNKNQSKIFMPNEIFIDLKNEFTDSSSHLTFAYGYYYLVNWMYRNAAYFTHKGQFIDNGVIKQILGYNNEYKKLDYIIKKNGILDQIGYTQTVKDFPTIWEYDNYEGLQFIMYSENKDSLYNLELPRKYTVKYPVKAFERIVDNLETNGTFYDIENTHEIPFEVFLYCLDNEQIGLTGFYIYSFIKCKNDYHRGGWDVALENMPKEMGIPERTISRYLDVLRKFNLIKAIHNQEYFCLILDPNERKANTYYANEIFDFTNEEQEYQKMNIVKKEDYEKMEEEKFLDLFGNKAHIPLEELPY